MDNGHKKSLYRPRDVTFVFWITAGSFEQDTFLGVSLVTSATNTPSSFALPFACLTGCCLHTNKVKKNEK